MQMYAVSRPCFVVMSVRKHPFCPTSAVTDRAAASHSNRARRVHAFFTTPPTPPTRIGGRSSGQGRGHRRRVSPAASQPASREQLFLPTCERAHHARTDRTCAVHPCDLRAQRRQSRWSHAAHYAPITLPRRGPAALICDACPPCWESRYMGTPGAPRVAGASLPLLLSSSKLAAAAGILGDGRGTPAHMQGPLDSMAGPRQRAWPREMVAR